MPIEPELSDMVQNLQPHEEPAPDWYRTLAGALGALHVEMTMRSNAQIAACETIAEHAIATNKHVHGIAFNLGILNTKFALLENALLFLINSTVAEEGKEFETLGDIPEAGDYAA